MSILAQWMPANRIQHFVYKIIFVFVFAFSHPESANLTALFFSKEFCSVNLKSLEQSVKKNFKEFGEKFS